MKPPAAAAGVHYPAFSRVPRYRRIRGRGLAAISPQEETMSIKRMDSGPRMSQAVVHAGVVYLAGQVAQARARRLGRRSDR